MILHSDKSMIMSKLMSHLDSLCNHGSMPCVRRSFAMKFVWRLSRAINFAGDSLASGD